MDKQLNEKQTKIVIQAVDAGYPTKKSETNIIVRLIGNLRRTKTRDSTEAFLQVFENKKNIILMKVD